MNDAQIRAAQLLKEITPSTIEKRKPRSSELLASDEIEPPYSRSPANWCKGWFLPLERNFAESLDIRLTQKSWKEFILDKHGQKIPDTDENGKYKLNDKGKIIYQSISRYTLVWTQGSSFDFRVGYIIHNNLEAMTIPWGEALNTLKYSIQISQASPAIPASPESPRNPGSLTFELYSPNASRNGVEKIAEYKTTQDDFVRFLITGEIKLCGDDNVTRLPL